MAGSANCASVLGMTDPLRLLLAFDGSAAAADAIRAAGRLFPGAAAVVLHIRSRPSGAEHAALARIAMPDSVTMPAAERYDHDARERANEIAARGRRVAEEAGLHATAEVETGPSAWRALVQAAQVQDHDVIVCGARGRGAFARALLGSTSSALLHHAARPLLIVPSGAGSLDGPVVIGYDGSDCAREAIITAGRVLPGREAVVVYAWSSPFERTYVGEGFAAVPIDEVEDLTRDLSEILAEQGDQTAEEGAERATAAGLQARGVGTPATAGAWRALAATARAEGAAVLVTGCRGRGTLSGSVLGSVSSALAHNAELPVLVVR
jgi:nucleotide-binding universal stress UspA family protein